MDSITLKLKKEVKNAKEKTEILKLKNNFRTWIKFKFRERLNAKQQTKTNHNQGQKKSSY